jgi:hypothetical protein
MNRDQADFIRLVKICCCAVPVAVAIAVLPLAAQPMVVAGSPSYDSATGAGFETVGRAAVNSSGTAVGNSTHYYAAPPPPLGDRAVRWDASGTAATVLDNLGTNAGGFTNARANAVNDADTAVGYSEKYIANIDVGQRAVRWDASGTIATELGNLGLSAEGLTNAEAKAVNNAGIAVGYSNKYVEGASVGWRAVHWDASGTAATELGNLGTDGSGNTYATAFDVNDAGTAVGNSEKFVAGADVGNRAVRWNASGVPTELQGLGTRGEIAFANANAVNDVGTAVGYAFKYVLGNNVGQRAVRWDASGSTATELENLGVDVGDGSTYAVANAVNHAGTAVGLSAKYVGGKLIGGRAVRWDASGSVATELGNLGTDARGFTNAYAFAVDDAGSAVGYCEKYVAGIDVGSRAVMWGLDGAAIDLNDLGVVANPPDGSWLLTEANAITNNGWVAGVGWFTPTGGSPYYRAWVGQLGVPEPAAFWLAISGFAGCGVLRTTRRARGSVCREEKLSGTESAIGC